MVTFFNVLDGIRWCLAVQSGLLEESWPEELVKHPAAAKEMAPNNGPLIWNGIRIRMGIHVGNPSCRRNPMTRRMDYYGAVVNRASRVADSAHGGQIVCTEEVHQALVEAQNKSDFKKDVSIVELGEFPYKGIADLVKVYQITDKSLEARAPFPKLRIDKANIRQDKYDEKEYVQQLDHERELAEKEEREKAKEKEKRDRERAARRPLRPQSPTGEDDDSSDDDSLESHVPAK